MSPLTQIKPTPKTGQRNKSWSKQHTSAKLWTKWTKLLTDLKKVRSYLEESMLTQATAPYSFF